MRLIKTLLCAFAAVQNHVSFASGDSSCNCDGCPGSSTETLGRHTDFDSEICPEGSVATVTKLRTASSSGDYELLTWNTGGSTYTDDILGSPYKYRQATAGEGEEITCFQLNETELPVVGDQRSIQVKLNCESAKCEFLHDVEFGCAKTGVLTEDGASGGGVQVLCDVDDTIKCPYPQCTEVKNCELTDVKHYLAGADTRLNDGEFYPGVAELVLGLALGPISNGWLGNSSFVPAKPMLLSARPNEAKALLGISQKNELNRYFERVGRRERQPSFGVNVDSSKYGTLFDRANHKEFGQTKARHFNDMSNDSPNTRFLFMGDNGQGDVCAAQSMLESDNGRQMVAVLIHQTQPNPEKILDKCQQPDGQNFDLTLQDGDYDGTIHFHKTHSDAAAWALERNLISCCSAEAVHNAVAEWAACRCEGTEEVCAYNETTVPPPTGPYFRPSVRDAARSYCADVATDQATLASKISDCDPQGVCAASNPVPGSAFLPLDDESSSTLPSAHILTGAFAVAVFLQGLVALVTM